jgi:hypothetical protein
LRSLTAKSGAFVTIRLSACSGRKNASAVPMGLSEINPGMRSRDKMGGGCSVLVLGVENTPFR